MLKRLDHIGILVDDLAEAESLLKGMGLELDHTVELSGRLKASQFRCGNALIEVVEIFEPIERARRLGTAEARIEHIAIEVDDLSKTIDGFAGIGVRTQNPKPVSMDGFLNHWTTPDTTDGIVYQLMEREAQASNRPERAQEGGDQ